MNAIHVPALIDDTASLAWLHRASAELSWRSPRGRRGRDEETHVSQGTNYHLDHVRRAYVCSPHARPCFFFRLRIIFVPYALLARAYASSARSYFEEYSIRGASNAMGPSACQMITPALPCRARGRFTPEVRHSAGNLAREFVTPSLSLHVCHPAWYLNMFIC